MDAVLHINDIALSLYNTESEYSSPGYALINGDQIAFGDTASQLHRVYPSNSHNDFWFRLNQNPIQSSSKNIRHNADLAFMHLCDLRENLKDLRNCLISVPSNYASDELALLLGLLNAAKFNQVKLIDSALLASSLYIDSGNHTYVDLQLHQTVITSFNSDIEINVTNSKSIQDVSMLAIEKALEKVVTDELMNQSRFDAHYNAETEQLLYNKLPEIFSALSNNSSYNFEIEYQGHTHQVIINQESIQKALIPFYTSIKENIGSSEKIILNHFLHALPGCKTFFNSAIYSEKESVLKATQEYSKFINNTSHEVNYLNTLPAINKSQNDNTDSSFTEITHILVANHATALNQKTFKNDFYIIHFLDTQYRLKPLDNNTVLINNKEITVDTKLSLGDKITINNHSHTSRFISVD